MAFQPIQLDENTTIYIETTESQPERGNRGSSPTQQALEQFANMQNTIKAFSVYTLDAFKQISSANVDKVTLKFGINIGGEAGIPYITKGTVGSNLEITVECSFKNPQA